MPSLHPVEYVTIAVYLSLMLVVGWVFRRFNRNVDDYFRSGSRGTWWIVGMSAFMNAFSAWTFTGAAGVAYQAGWSAAVIFISNAAGFLLNFLFTGAWFRQMRVTTAPQVLRIRFGPATQQFYAGLNLITGLLHGGVQLFGLAIFCAQVFGLPVRTVIVLIGVVVLIYASVGGNWAALATDFLQGLILLPVTLLIAYLALHKVGGLSGFQHLVAERGLTNDFALAKAPGRFAAGAFGWGWMSAMMLKNSVTWNTIGSAVRFFSVKDGREARRASLLCMLLMLLGCCIWFFPPMVARLVYADQVKAAALGKPAEAAYAIASVNLLPPGLIGLMVVAMFAATMSAMDLALTRNAAVAIKDVYPALCRLFRCEPLPEARLFRLSHVISAVFGVLVILLALYYAERKGEGVFEIMINIGAYLSTPLVVPMFLGLFFRRVPGYSAFLSAGAGLLSSLVQLLTESLGWAHWNFQETVWLNFSVGTAVFGLTALGWKNTTPAYRQQVADFFRRMHTPVDFEREVGGATDLRQLVLLGCFTMTTGTLVCLLMPFAGSTGGALQAGFVGVTLLAIGLAMWLRGRRSV